MFSNREVHAVTLSRIKRWAPQLLIAHLEEKFLKNLRKNHNPDGVKESPPEAHTVVTVNPRPRLRNERPLSMLMSNNVLRIPFKEKFNNNN